MIDPMLPQPYRVQHVRHEIPDTFTLELEPAAGGDVPPFATGQFNMLYVFGVGEIPISISGDPARRKPLVHTTRAVGTVSRAMRALKPDDVIGVRGPFGSHWPIERAERKDIVIAAGGIGLAPLRSVMYHVISQREKYNKAVLLYGARTPADILYRRELQHWRTHFDLDVYVTVDRATGSWRGSVGVVTQLIPRAPFDPRNTVAMVCGPEIMMRFTAAELEKRGVATENIFVSMERNMKCAVGFCGHCQYGPHFICKDGPVFQYSQIQDLLTKQEV
ncbi:MAG TPA: FAD/NAD(P)-binding protein [Ktedonobacteraceae bacterium]|nr:FAD/NAD(P)-binding protein [Ktedonobacteraceae bacterium]